MSSQTDHQRAALVAELARNKELSDVRVLDAMGRVPRHLFVPPELVGRAYEDNALSIGNGQTISQPYVVGMMTQALRLTPKSRVLEIGTGSGYQTAVLAELCGSVVTIECIGALALAARARFHMLQTPHVLALVGDGTRGYPPMAPYDGIIITAASEKVPAPLWDQLGIGGRLVATLGDAGDQDLHVFHKDDRGITDEVLFACRFVPLVGEYGRR